MRVIVRAMLVRMTVAITVVVGMGVRM